MHRKRQLTWLRGMPELDAVDCLAAEAMQIMQQQKISALCVVDDQQKVCGALNMHDLIRAGIV